MKKEDKIRLCEILKERIQSQEQGEIPLFERVGSKRVLNSEWAILKKRKQIYDSLCNSNKN